MIPEELQYIRDQLTQLDEIELLDLLSIDSEMIVEAFEDRIEDNYAKIKKTISFGIQEEF